jgi:hypothetical protein
MQKVEGATLFIAGFSRLLDDTTTVAKSDAGRKPTDQTVVDLIRYSGLCGFTTSYDYRSDR